jgi:hypothetical protein
MLAGKEGVEAVAPAGLLPIVIPVTVIAAALVAGLRTVTVSEAVYAKLVSAGSETCVQVAVAVGGPLARQTLESTDEVGEVTETPEAD